MTLEHLELAFSRLNKPTKIHSTRDAQFQHLRPKRTTHGLLNEKSIFNDSP